MHELSLVSTAIAKAIATAEGAGARHVRRLTFTLAPTGHVTRETVEFLVHALASGTLVEGAEVDFGEDTSEGGGAELMLASIDVEVA